MASKPINIRWIRTGLHPYEKIMSSIVLYPVFYKYKMYNHKIKTILYLYILYQRKVYNKNPEFYVVLLFRKLFILKADISYLDLSKYS